METLAQHVAHRPYWACTAFICLAVGCAATEQLEPTPQTDTTAQLSPQTGATGDTGKCSENRPWFLSWEYSGDWSAAASAEHKAQYPTDPFSRFDGWVTVERSADTELILAADPQQNGARDAPASTNAIAHCNIYGADLPVIEPGARVWLHFSGDFVPGAARALNYRHDFGREMSVRAEPEGSLLLAGIAWPAEAGRIETDALTFVEPVELCSMEATACWHDGRLSQHSLLALADAPRRVSAGSASVIELDGAPYTLTFIDASQLTGTKRDYTNCHPDFPGDTRLWASADVRAQDPQPVIDALQRGVLPECSLGAAATLDVDASLDQAGVSTELVDADVVYRAIENERYLFDVTGTDFTLALTVDTLRTEPAPGTHYSLNYRFDAFVLRTAIGGEIVAAWLWLPEPSKVRRDTLDVFASWLALPITREQVCSYEPQQSPAEPGQFLMQVTFGTQPVTIIREGFRGAISIGGQNYEALVSKARRATTIWIAEKR